MDIVSKAISYVGSYEPPFMVVMAYVFEIFPRLG